jgi:hypothetical protein
MDGRRWLEVGERREFEREPAAGQRGWPATSVARGLSQRAREVETWSNHGCNIEMGIGAAELEDDEVRLTSGPIQPKWCLVPAWSATWPNHSQMPPQGII